MSVVAKKFNPKDYLRGSKSLGENYTAWDTYGQGTPDFGIGNGPGLPYHEVQKKVKTPTYTPPKPGPARNTNIPHWGNITWDKARTDAIRKRLGWS